ncbi:MAG: hypothetical protein MJZ08_02520 [Bacteroidaceae bacterium]|nr:hypothetical protein [Bacteroidaceae bacterium]
MSFLCEDEIELRPVSLNTKLNNEEYTSSLNQIISVQYNQIDLGKTGYGFDQKFEGNEANLYFMRMKEFAGRTINDVINDGGKNLHFFRTDIRGNIKKVFDGIDENIAKTNPMIFHFALDPEYKGECADRKKGTRNPRIYFMVGIYGMIHILFFDPYHEINPNINM